MHTLKFVDVKDMVKKGGVDEGHCSIVFVIQNKSILWTWMTRHLRRKRKDFDGI